MMPERLNLQAVIPAHAATRAGHVPGRDAVVGRRLPVAPNRLTVIPAQVGIQAGDLAALTATEVVQHDRSAHALRAWVPAFAGMTVKWFSGTGVPMRYGPGSRLAPG